VEYSLFFPLQGKAKLLSSLSQFFFFFKSLSLSLCFLEENTYTLTAVVAHVKIYMCLIFRKRTKPT
jgi:hypothetical protein